MPMASPAPARVGRLPPRVTVTRAVLPLSSIRTPRRSAYDGAPTPWSCGPSSRVATGLYVAAGALPAAERGVPAGTSDGCVDAGPPVAPDAGWGEPTAGEGV